MYDNLIKYYSIDSLCVDISNFTGTSLSYVLEKPFIGYLDSYLCKWKNSNTDVRDGFGITVLLEDDYIDSSYLDDYAKYYSKNFSNIKKKCLRVHFFQSEISEVEKINKITTAQADIEKLKESYIGFLVIRPIPEFFISKACLSLWPESEDSKHFYLRKTVHSSICGIDFSVQTIPFMEQDHVVSVCATSSLWTFFYANKYANITSLSSPFEITKNALIQNQTYSGSNLTPGYTIDMICQCIKDNCLSPIIFDVSKLDKDDVKEITVTFLESKYPVILGLEVYNSNKQKIGLHAVTVLGYNLEKQKLYIHDDRLGFYVSLEYDGDCYWKLTYPETASKSIPKQKEEYYKPTDIVTGLYSKIRLPLKEIRHFCQYLKSDLVEYYGELSAQFEIMNFDVCVIESNLFKSKVRFQSDRYFNAEEVINMSLPKYIWQACFYYGRNNECFTLVFDATEMPQGDILLCILFSNENFKKVLYELYKKYEEKIQNGITLTKVFNKKVYSFYKYFKSFEEDTYIYASLDKLFGKAKGPKYINANEFIADELKNQKPMKFTTKKDVLSQRLDRTVKYYLWIIDEEGFLYIGKEDKEHEDSPYKGHPTLIRGRKGRIGGELHPIKDKEENFLHWEIDSKSGRYSWGNVSEYLRNAVTERFEVYFPDEPIKIKSGF